MSVLRCLGSGPEVASLGNVLFSEGVPWPSQGRGCSGLWVSPPARFTLPGAHGDSSGGLPGNYSNFLAPSHWVGRQVPLMNWLQGTWIGEEVNGQQVRLLLWSSSDCFYSTETRPAPSLPALHVLYFLSISVRQERTKLARLNSVFNIIMTAVKAVNITQNQREKRRTSPEKCGEKGPTLHFFLPSQEVTATHSFLP